ncbi:MAG: L,D-transpeptidase family protein [Actinomycetaceae bacterium]|nr:L,D-transpeptidase family protein [Arcanobacterium sp.]MDD7505588.1 L,D-transpeptidase family protein [Actinomycetaceae bacterium]MDY6143793.1 L,D-transpeptidase family protein [Arcanobacterium sp.]
MTTAKKVGISLAALALAAIVACAIYVLYFFIGERALPNTYVGDVKVSGKTASEISADLKKVVASGEMNFSGTGISATSAALSDLGVAVDTDAIARQATANTSKPLAYVKAPFVTTRVLPEYTKNADAITTFANKLLEGSELSADPTEPAIITEGEKFIVQPGADGQGIDPDQLYNAATRLLTTQKNVKANVKLTAIEPTISEEDLQQVANQANEMLEADVSLQAGDSTITADAATKLAWISCTKDAPQLDEDAIRAWVEEHSKQLNVEEIVGVRYKNTNGDITLVKREARPGVHVTNIDDVSQSIVGSFSQAKAVNAAFTTASDEPKWEEKVIAPGAENLPYPAADGEKWIDVNVSNNTVTAYVGATPVHGPVGMIDGAPATPTILGTYAIYLKRDVMTMRGKNVDGTPYVTPNVPHAMFFTGGYALHGSSAWRSSWGYDAGAAGSHGCVNLSNAEAAWFYNWAPIGTTVVSHR